MEKSNPIPEIEKIARGNDQTKKELIEIFIRQISKQVKQINDYKEAKDWDELKKIAHTMKSSFLYLRMKRPIELANLLMETSGIEIETTSKQVNELSAICLLVISELKKEDIK